MTEKEAKKGITRRGFIKGAAAGAGVATATASGLLGGWPVEIAYGRQTAGVSSKTEPIAPVPVLEKWDKKTDVKPETVNFTKGWVSSRFRSTRPLQMPWQSSTAGMMGKCCAQ